LETFKEAALSDLRQTIRTMAKQHGFDLCHITRPEIERKHLDTYADWLSAGMQGDMAWMAEQTRMARRRDPASMLEGVKSVITVAMRYSPPAYTLAMAKSEPGRGVIAAYAQGDDYHDTLRKRLKVLARALDVLLGKHDQRVYVDTAPVLEHAFAAASGLGWQGRHSLTINRDIGSWFLLGEIFTTAVLEPDTAASAHCGSCTACMAACPTGAIVAPYIVDARRCISYLTIEYRGFIPPALRPLMGNRIFGCDDCQAVCPWNRYTVPPSPDLLSPRSENVLPRLEELLALDEMAFRKRFRKSPVRRAGRGGLLRNVAIAMGNSGDPRYTEQLTGALRDAEALIRGHAAWALARLGAAGSLSTLHDALSGEADAQVATEIAQAISTLEESERA